MLKGKVGCAYFLFQYLVKTDADAEINDLY